MVSSGDNSSKIHYNTTRFTVLLKQLPGESPSILVEPLAVNLGHPLRGSTCIKNIPESRTEMTTFESKTLNLGKILAKLQSNSRFGEAGNHDSLYVYRLLGAIQASTTLSGSKPDKDKNPDPRYGLLPVSVAREYYHDFGTLFEDLAITGVVTIERTHDKKTYLTVNPEYLIGYGRSSGSISEFVEDDEAPQISSLELTDAQYNIVNAPMYKSVIRGLKSIAPVNRISLELPDGGLDAIRIAEGVNDTTWASQLPYLQAILTGNIQSTRRRDKRCYSTITSLSSSFHKYLRIDGCSLVEMDQSSTYLTILPALMDKEAEFLGSAPASGKYNEDDVELAGLVRDEVTRLRRMISDGVDIYEQIAEYSTKPISRSECKKRVCSWICWNSPDKRKAFPEVANFFEDRFPNITRRLGSMRHNPYTIPSRLNRIESSIFVKASKILNDHGFYCLVKHDCLLVKITDIKDAQAALYCTFAEQRVEMNMKVKDPNGMISPDFNINGRPHQLTPDMIATPVVRAERIGSDVFDTIDSAPNCRDIAKEATRALSQLFPRCAKIKLTTKSKGKGKTRLVWEANVVIDKKKWRHVIGFASNQLPDDQLIELFTAAARDDGFNIKFIVDREGNK